MKNKFLAVVACFIAIHATGQTVELSTELPTNKTIRKSRPQYIQAGFGLNKGSVRDFATSPITYKGVLLNYSLGLTRLDDRRESRATLRFNHGTYRHKSTQGVEVKSKTKVYALYANYMKLYRLNRISNDRWNFKLGGMGDVNMDVRYNEDLMNAGVGYEVFNTWFLSGKVSRVFRRQLGEVDRFLFFKLKRPMVSMLSYQLNVPIMNNTIRNGFSYIGNESLNTIPLFKGYEAKAFSGIRLSSELSYTRQIQNGNMWRLSYLWDAYAVGEKFNRFEMAHHILEVSILFHLNKSVQR